MLTRILFGNAFGAEITVLTCSYVVYNGFFLKVKRKTSITIKSQSEEVIPPPPHPAKFSILDKLKVFNL